jgi:hypothetical protein
MTLLLLCAAATVVAGALVLGSAKFPAPPADVGYASLQAPGFAWIDRVPLGS